jgi:hypothetical protein
MVWLLTFILKTIPRVLREIRYAQENDHKLAQRLRRRI